MKNASEKFVRATCYKLPSKESWINKFNFDFSLSFNPLYEDTTREESEEEQPPQEQIPYLDKTNEKIFRCERCGGFVNPFFEFLENNTKYKCNLCSMTNQVPDYYKNYLTNLSSQNMPAYETVSAVCDLLVDDSYKMAKFEKQNVLIALEFSVKSLSNGTYMHALNSLESTLESLAEDINIGICLFDAGVTFFDVDVDEENIGNFLL
jgi:protein transport protein SEC24